MKRRIDHARDLLALKADMRRRRFVDAETDLVEREEIMARIDAIAREIVSGTDNPAADVFGFATGLKTAANGKAFRAETRARRARVTTPIQGATSAAEGLALAARVFAA